MQYLIIFIIICSSAFAEEKISLQLKWEHQFQFAGYYAALEQGYYKEYGLDVEIRENNKQGISTASEEVIKGRADYGVGSSSLLSDISRGQPLMLLAAIFEHSPLVILCHKHSEIRNPKNLEQKKIMLSKGEDDSVLLSRMLEKEKVSYTSVPLDFEAFKKGEADAITAYLGNEPYELTQLGIPFSILDPANYGFDAYSDILFTSKNEYKNHPKRVHDFTQASLRGWKYAMNHQKEIANLIINKYNHEKTFEALMFEAKMIGKHALVNINNVGDIDISKLLHMVLLMNEAGLLKDEIDIYKHIYPGQLCHIKFSEKESTFITEHPILNYSNISWQPQENANQRKEISQKYLDLISLKSGLNFKYLQKEPAAYALAELERGKIDLFVGIQENTHVATSIPLWEYPLVIVTRNDVDYVSHLNSLNMKTIALVKGNASSVYIENNFPKIQKVYVENIKEALDLVASSAVYATAEVLPLVSSYIKKFNMSNLKISGEFPHKYSLSINIRKDSPELLSIINKVIKSISFDEHNFINDQWKAPAFVNEEDTKALASGLIIVCIFLFILVYSNWRLREAIKIKISTKKELRHMLDVVDQNVYMSMTDIEGNITYVSEAFCRLTGYTKAQLMGQNHRLLKNPKTDKKFYENLWRTISSGRIWKGELENITKQGEAYWVHASITPIYNDEGKIFSFMAIRKDITSVKHIEKLAITDALSDLYNRRYFNMMFDKEIKRVKRDKGTLTFIMLDIDHFKLYNDTYGHLKGDEVILAVSMCLKEVCKRATDQVFRLGGEEFGVLLLGLNEKQVHDFSQKLIKAVENLNIKHEENIPYSWVTVSLGAVVCTFDESTSLDAKDMYQLADEAMYTSKQTGRNRIFISQI